jgi:hypothetical protein
LAAVVTVMVEPTTVENEGGLKVTDDGHSDDGGLQERLIVPVKPLVRMGATENEAAPPWVTVCAYGVATNPDACDVTTLTGTAAERCTL